MWFFPGAGQGGPLTVPMLGPPAELLTRLFTCGTGLYIVQHSDVITPEVTSLIAAYAQDAGAWEASESLEYMIIDGPEHGAPHLPHPRPAPACVRRRPTSPLDTLPV